MPKSPSETFTRFWANFHLIPVINLTRLILHRYDLALILVGHEVSLSIENTLWANTVVASGTATGIVIYTGADTRSVMNNLEARSKVGLLDYEVNSLTKLLFVSVVILSLAMVFLKGVTFSQFSLLSDKNSVY